MSEREHNQLIKKFRLVHMTNALSFNMYFTLANFERDIHKVDIGIAYTDCKSGLEILHFLSLSNCMQKITNPLNEDELMFTLLYSMGQAMQKLINKKELLLIKTCEKSKPTFNVMSLKEVKDSSAPGLKATLEESIGKMSFTFDWKSKEVGMCSDGTNVNVAAYNLAKKDLGEHYLLIFCPAHKLELPIKDTFKTSNFNEEVQKGLMIYFIFFKKPT